MVNYARGVRPPNAPADYVEADCSNPMCDRTTWIPPQAMEAAREHGSTGMPVCSAECSLVMVKALAKEGRVGFVDPQQPLLPLRIDEMFAYIATDETGEGIPAMPISGTTMPLVGADRERMESLRPYAERLAKMAGKKFKLVRFSVREDLEEIG